MAEAVTRASISWVAVLAALWLAWLKGDVRGGVSRCGEGWERTDEQGGEDVEEFHFGSSCLLSSSTSTLQV